MGEQIPNSGAQWLPGDGNQLHGSALEATSTQIQKLLLAKKSLTLLAQGQKKQVFEQQRQIMEQQKSLETSRKQQSALKPLTAMFQESKKRNRDQEDRIGKLQQENKRLSERLSSLEEPVTPTPLSFTPMTFENQSDYLPDSSLQHVENLLKEYSCMKMLMATLKTNPNKMEELSKQIMQYQNLTKNLEIDNAVLQEKVAKQQQLATSSGDEKSCQVAELQEQVDRLQKAATAWEITSQSLAEERDLYKRSLGNDCQTILRHLEREGKCTCNCEEKETVTSTSQEETQNETVPEQVAVTTTSVSTQQSKLASVSTQQSKLVCCDREMQTDPAELTDQSESLMSTTLSRLYETAPPTVKKKLQDLQESNGILRRRIKELEDKLTGKQAEIKQSSSSSSLLSSASSLPPSTSGPIRVQHLEAELAVKVKAEQELQEQIDLMRQQVTVYEQDFNLEKQGKEKALAVVLDLKTQIKRLKGTDSKKVRSSSANAWDHMHLNPHVSNNHTGNPGNNGNAGGRRDTRDTKLTPHGNVRPYTLSSSSLPGNLYCTQQPSQSGHQSSNVLSSFSTRRATSEVATESTASARLLECPNCRDQFDQTSFLHHSESCTEFK